MSEPASPPTKLPLTIMDRSPFDHTRLMWSGVGNIILGLSCIFGAGGVAGVIFGILFVLLAVATWAITSFGQRPWYSIPSTPRIVAGIGSVIGVAFLYVCFGIFFLTIWLVRLIASGLG